MSRVCGNCRLPIGEYEVVRCSGSHVTHQPYRCVELLQAEIDRLKGEVEVLGARRKADEPLEVLPADATDHDRYRYWKQRAKAAEGKLRDRRVESLNRAIATAREQAFHLDDVIRDAEKRNRLDFDGLCTLKRVSARLAGLRREQLQGHVRPVTELVGHVQAGAVQWEPYRPPGCITIAERLARVRQDPERAAALDRARDRLRDDRWRELYDVEVGPAPEGGSR